MLSLHSPLVMAKCIQYKREFKAIVTHTNRPMTNLEQVNLEGTIKHKVEPTQKFYLGS